MRSDVQPRLLQVDLCVTFHRAKRGHYLTGVAPVRPAVIDIGLPDGPDSRDAALLALPAKAREHVRLVDPDPGPMRKAWLRHVAGIGRGGHKYERGHALILGGGPGKGGAARMAARAALRVGAGLVTIAVPPAALQENAARLDAVMLQAVRDPEAVRDALQDKRLSSVTLGPGLGMGERTRDLARAVLDMSGQERRVVLDADVLSSFESAPETLFALCGPHVVLTPHEGEFARLFPDLGEKTRRKSHASPQMSKIDAAQEAARRSGATVLLKGEATVVASPDGTTGLHPALYDRQAPWLGTAGAGDVLAGLIGGILAAPQIMDVHRAVEAAAWLHVEAARSFGPGLIAEDLPEELPNLFRALGL